MMFTIYLSTQRAIFDLTLLNNLIILIIIVFMNTNTIFKYFPFRLFITENIQYYISLCHISDEQLNRVLGLVFEKRK